MLAYVGVDARKDVEWIDGKTFDGTMQQFVDGKADEHWDPAMKMTP